MSVLQTFGKHQERETTCTCRKQPVRTSDVRGAIAERIVGVIKKLIEFQLLKNVAH